MNSLLLAAGCAAAYVVAYRTYGRFLGRRILGIRPGRPTPAHTKTDGVDFVPTGREILFGHHYTSIAGTGPIVGPAIGVIWGWVPAVLWVVFGSIFMGAVHDLGSLLVSVRHEGRSIGDVAGDLISPRVRVIFLVVIALLLLIVIAVFCLVIATLFDLYPEAVLSIWIEIPIAVGLGYLVYRRRKPALLLSMAGLVLLYGAIWLGTLLPLRMPTVAGLPPAVVWTVILLVYAYIASTLPVWRLLQPRDYINGHELFVVMGVLALALVVGRPPIVAPAFRTGLIGTPPLWPILFVTIACGAHNMGTEKLMPNAAGSMGRSDRPGLMVVTMHE